MTRRFNLNLLSPSRGSDDNSAFDEGLARQRIRELERQLEEQKLGSAHVRQREARFRAFLEQSPDAICVVVNNRITYANPAFFSLLDISEEGQIIGRAPSDFLPGYLDTALPSTGNSATPPPSRTEHELIKPDGSRLEVEVTGITLADESLSATQLIVRDLSQAKHSDRQIRRLTTELESLVAERTRELEKTNCKLIESTQRQQVLIDALPDRIYRVTRGGLFRDSTSPRTQTVLLPTQVPKSARETSFPESITALFEQALDAAVASGENQSFEFSLAAPERPQLFEARVVPCGISEAIAVVRDVTDARQAEREREMFSALVRNSSDFIAIADLHQRLIYLNEAGRRLVGLGPDEDITQYSVCDFCTGTCHPKFCAEIQSCLVEGSWHGESTLENLRTGEKRPFLTTAFVLCDPNGAEQLAIATVRRDITELKQAEEDVRLLNEELEQRVRIRTTELEASNRELESFSYSVSHDLRAPLRGINGFSRLLLTDYADRLDDTGRNYLHRIRAATERMGNLIDDLINLAQVTRRHLHVTRVNLSQLAQQIVDTLKAAEPGREVQVVITPDVVADGDASLLEIVLQNLLANAWKFTSNTPSARIEFGTTSEHGWLTFYVRDNGAGFDMSYVEKLFKPFQRLHGVNEYPGTGIGLATVQRVVTRHGGRAWAEGQVGCGATFHFTLGTRNQILQLISSAFSPGQ